MNLYFALWHRSSTLDRTDVVNPLGRDCWPHPAAATLVQYLALMNPLDGKISPVYL
jgi:hypothetical protein